MSSRGLYGDYGDYRGSQDSSSRYNSSYGVDPWNESSTADVSYGDAYTGGYGDDSGHDPYNFKIKDPKKERKKKERKHAQNKLEKRRAEKSRPNNIKVGEQTKSSKEGS